MSHAKSTLLLEQLLRSGPEVKRASIREIMILKKPTNK